MPRLLVSVRSVEEARAAVAGGCDLLDLKEPHRGSLGRLDDQTTHEICSFLAVNPQAPPISVALGELAEWTDASFQPRLPANVALVKLGLANCSSSWRSDWRELRNVFGSTGSRVEWVAVHYADQTAASPPLNEILSEAIAVGCRGLLIDTCGKRAGRLLDFVTATDLMQARAETAAAGLFFAVAGSLRASDLPQLVDVSPDIIAVRGAVCRSGDRTAAVSEEAVRAFRREIGSVFSPKDIPIETV
jgi:uncharacterized protein (UPF0264 family)